MCDLENFVVYYETMKRTLFRYESRANSFFLFCPHVYFYEEEGMKIITGDDTGLIKVQTVSVLQAVLLQ